MSESALEAPRVGQPSAPGNKLAQDSAPGTRSILARGRAWWVVTAVLIAVSAGLVAWARTAPSYDAFGWLVWGFQTLHGKLDLGGAPSWKPLPFVFTVPYAIFGMTLEKWLWQVTAVTISLGGAIVAARIAFRVTLTGSALGGTAAPAGNPSSARRTAALIAGAFAGLALLGTEDYMHYILSVQSDPMIVTFTLAAVDAYLCDRPRLAIVLGTFAALGRPEAWPFLGLYGLWCWFRVPRSRWLLVGAAAVIAFMWFGIPWITNGRPFVSAQLALNSPRELKHNQIGGTIGRFHELFYLPVWIAAAVGVAWGALRRDRLVLALAGIVVAWVVVEIAFALHGWPALPRYMFEAGGLVAVLAGVAVGWALTELPKLRGGLPRWAGLPVVAVLIAVCVPGAVARLRTERTDLKHERHRATQIALLGKTTAALGGWLHIRHCANPTANVEWVSALAWWMHADVGVLGHLPSIEVRAHRAVVLFTPLSQGGWSVQPFHLHRRSYATCRLLQATYALAPGHPNGVLTRP